MLCYSQGSAVRFILLTVSSLSAKYYLCLWHKMPIYAFEVHLWSMKGLFHPKAWWIRWMSKILNGLCSSDLCYVYMMCLNFYILSPVIPDTLVIETRRRGGRFVGYGYGHGSGNPYPNLYLWDPYQLAGFPIPVSNTIYCSPKSTAQWIRAWIYLDWGLMLMWSWTILGNCLIWSHHVTGLQMSQLLKRSHFMSIWLFLFIFL